LGTRRCFTVSLVSFLDVNARRDPDHLACVVGDDSLSYTELRDARCRGALKPGGSTGENALDPGFHDVPAGPAHPNRDADGADVA
jgi:hypothetical protein